MSNSNHTKSSKHSTRTFESSVDSFVTALSREESSNGLLYDPIIHVGSALEVRNKDDDDDDVTPVIIQKEFHPMLFSPTVQSISNTDTASDSSKKMHTFSKENTRDTLIVESPMKYVHDNSVANSPDVSMLQEKFQPPNSKKSRITSSYYQPLEEAHQSFIAEQFHDIEREEEEEEEEEQGNETFNETTMDSINTNNIDQERFFTSSISSPNTSVIKNTETANNSEDYQRVDENGHGVLKNFQLELDEQNYTHLFIVATRPFDKSVLEEEEDKKVCLSFEVDDLAFVHAIEEAGWGEVTLIRSSERGWVPLNFFTDAIKPVENFIPDNFRHLSSTESKHIITLRAKILSRRSLIPLFSSCGRFLVLPQRVPFKSPDELTFDISDINNIKSGIKKLLEQTGCISRSNDLVQSKPLVRKTRKRLLADWYSITLKADSYKNTTSTEKIKTLEKMVIQVIRRAFLFYNIWGIEKQAFENERRLSNLKDRSSKNVQPPENIQDISSSLPKNMKYLKAPPLAISRLNEINSYLFTYIGLILGRMDIIEHNTAGCEVLEYVVYQIILLLRELLYISKACSTLIKDKYNNSYENNLDHNLDPLLSLVSELVSAVKVFVTKTLQESSGRATSLHQSQIFFNNQTYTHTEEASDFIRILSQMAGFISSAITSCNNYLRIVGDFHLSSEKEYFDFENNSISPENFVKICSNSILQQIERLEIKIGNSGTESVDKNFSKFSTIRAGHGSLSNQLLLSNEGGEFLKEAEHNRRSIQGVLETHGNFLGDSVFEKFTVPEQRNKQNKTDSMLIINDRSVMTKELAFDPVTQELLGGSFRALVFHLTDEVQKADEFFKTCFLMNFRSFGTSKDFIAHLFARFDTENKSFDSNSTDGRGPFSSKASQIKHKRKVVVKMIQIWLESYWNQKEDYGFLPTLMNFFNECASVYLPIESRNLIGTIAKLLTISPDANYSQLVIKSIRTSNINSIISRFSNISLNGSESVNEAVIDHYQLANEPDEDLLPVPIAGLGTSNLLSKTHLQECSNLVRKYRNIAKYNANTCYLDELIFTWFLNIQNQEPVNFSFKDVQFCDMNPMEVAKQLTLIEARLFSNIDPNEFLQGNFLEKNLHKGFAPNISKIITFTNALSNYVIESIVSPYFTMEVKRKRIRQWMKISLSCLYFKNFNSLASIMIALQSHIVSRLASVWEGLTAKDNKLLEFLMKIIHPNQNYKVYRKKLALFVQQAKKGFLNYNSDNTSTLYGNENNTMIIPFFNLFLQDLTMIDEGNNRFLNPDSFRPNNIINIDKYFKITKVLENVQELQVFIVENLSSEECSDNRDSLFLVGKETVQPLGLLQEFILYELWKVHSLYFDDPDRGYEMSLKMVPRG